MASAPTFVTQTDVPVGERSMQNIEYELTWLFINVGFSSIDLINAMRMHAQMFPFTCGEFTTCIGLFLLKTF